MYTDKYGWVSDNPVADEQMDIMYPKGADKADKDFKVRFTKAYRDVVMALMHVKDNPTIELSYVNILMCMNKFIDIMDEWDSVFEDESIRSSVERLVYAVFFSRNKKSASFWMTSSVQRLKLFNQALSKASCTSQLATALYSIYSISVYH